MGFYRSVQPRQPKAGEEADVEIRTGGGLVVIPIHAPAMAWILELRAHQPGDVARVPATVKQAVGDGPQAGRLEQAVIRKGQQIVDVIRKIPQGSAVVGFRPTRLRVVAVGVKVLMDPAQA